MDPSQRRRLRGRLGTRGDRESVEKYLDTDAGFAVVQTLEGLTATGALLIQRAAGGRRLDEDSDTRTLDLAASLAYPPIKFELEVSTQY